MCDEAALALALEPWWELCIGELCGVCAGGRYFDADHSVERGAGLCLFQGVPYVLHKLGVSHVNEALEDCLLGCGEGGI